VIFLIMVYAGAVKWPLKNLKLSYFMFYRHPIPEFAEMPIKFTGTEEEFDHELKQRIYMNTILYLVAKFFSMVFLITILVALLCIKYSIPHSREFFLPVETTCGPKLFWNEVRGRDVDIGEYFCHYKAEWTVFLLTILTDIFTVVLIILFIIQALSLVVMFTSSYFNFNSMNVCCCVPESNKELDIFLDIHDTIGDNGQFQEKLLTWDVHNTAHIGPRTSYANRDEKPQL